MKGKKGDSVLKSLEEEKEWAQEAYQGKQLAEFPLGFLEKHVIWLKQQPSNLLLHRPDVWEIFILNSFSLVNSGHSLGLSITEAAVGHAFLGIKERALGKESKDVSTFLRLTYSIGLIVLNHPKEVKLSILFSSKGNCEA